MKIKKYKIPTWFITENLHHKVGIHYEKETKRAYELLDIMSSKYFKIDRRKKLNQIEVTEEEYQTWYVYFLEYYIDDESIYAGTQDYKEAKKLLNDEFKKWNGRIQALEDGDEKDKAQNMLNIIADARKKYG